ncbi:hypothetical protein RS030_122019 [Cryptosporidium xiaoi]|uniref:Uncharacterized protein n=1 Tax=Cryptosporidium xiaoi TaxID=659607 RepID=A0AAV9Y2M5_9CRYT
MFGERNMYLFSEKKLTLFLLFSLCFFKLANCVRFSLNLNQLEFKCICKLIIYIFQQ